MYCFSGGKIKIGNEDGSSSIFVSDGFFTIDEDYEMLAEILTDTVRIQNIEPELFKNIPFGESVTIKLQKAKDSQLEMIVKFQS